MAAPYDETLSAILSEIKDDFTLKAEEKLTQQFTLTLTYQEEKEIFFYHGAGYARQQWFKPGEVQWYLRSLLQDAYYLVNCKSPEDLANEIIIPDDETPEELWNALNDLDQRLSNLFGAELYTRLRDSDYDQ